MFYILASSPVNFCDVHYFCRCSSQEGGGSWTAENLRNQGKVELFILVLFSVFISFCFMCYSIGGFFKIVKFLLWGWQFYYVAAVNMKL